MGQSVKITEEKVSEIENTSTEIIPFKEHKKIGNEINTRLGICGTIL